jgi:hypothetical protein
VSVLNLILSHQRADAVANMIAWWKECVPVESILIAFGGTKTDFDLIEHKSKFFVDDARLRTRDHQRELQSYTRLFEMAAEFLQTSNRDFDFVHFAEYDHVPMVSDLNDRQIETMKAESADVLAYHVQRVDGTNRPHFLYHVANHAFVPYWSKITVRSDPRVVLWMFGSGSFWTREAVEAIAGIGEPFPMYLEIYLPTLAHHLGFRVRDFGEQNRFVEGLGDLSDRIKSARSLGAWTLHPVKELPSSAHPR